MTVSRGYLLTKQITLSTGYWFIRWRALSTVRTTRACRARFSKAPETFPASRVIFSSSASKNGEVHAPETSCIKRNSDHIKNMWIKQLCNLNARDFALGLRARKVSASFEKRTFFRPGQRNKLITDWPVRQFSDALVEILAHEDTILANFMRHVHFFKEFIGHHLQRILGPSLSNKKNIPYYYVALSHKDWELPNSRIWLAETDIDRGLDFPIWPVTFRSEKVAR